MFVKYNGLLRGLQSPNNKYLTKSMMQLCCRKDIADQYCGSLSSRRKSSLSDKLSFEQAKTSLNTYTTTLHGINSSIIKLGKLTVATKVRTTLANPPSEHSLSALARTCSPSTVHPAGLSRHLGHGSPCVVLGAQ